MKNGLIPAFREGFPEVCVLPGRNGGIPAEEEEVHGFTPRAVSHRADLHPPALASPACRARRSPGSDPPRERGGRTSTSRSRECRRRAGEPEQTRPRRPRPIRPVGAAADDTAEDHARAAVGMKHLEGVAGHGAETSIPRRATQRPARERISPSARRAARAGRGARRGRARSGWGGRRGWVALSSAWFLCVRG